MCPLIVDYLNFVRPYDSRYSRAKLGSQRIFSVWSSTFESCEVSKPECWLQGRMSPHGHTISVSDVWLVAHYYGILFTTLGEIESFHLL